MENLKEDYQRLYKFASNLLTQLELNEIDLYELEELDHKIEELELEKVVMIIRLYGENNLGVED